MNKLFLIISLATSIFCQAQDESRFGLSVGVNQYYIGADFLFSRSAAGFSVGAVSTVPVSDNSEVLVGISFSQYNFDLMGRENELANPEWIRFGLQRINLDCVYDYDIFHFMEDDLAVGLCAGASVAFLNDIYLKDTDKEDYTLDPYGVDPEYLMMDEASESMTINVFGVVGATARYRDIEATLRYNFGLTDCYANFPATSPYVEFTGKDSYLNFQVTYYLGDNF